MKALVIEKQAVLNNIAVVRERAGQAVIYAVLSGDGQGAGLVELATICRDAGIARFAVSEPEDVAALRREILMLRSTTDRTELEQLVDCNAVCSVGSAETGAALNALAAERATIVEAHIQIDTGLGFGGFPVEEPEKIMMAFRTMPNVAVSGVYTQVHFQEGANPQALERIKAFEAVLEQAHQEGFETGAIHIAGSYALLTYDFVRRDAVRAGSVLMGRCRRSKGDKLIEVGYGEATLSEINWLPKGHTIGMRKPLTLKKPTRVALLPVGYENGFGVESPEKEEGFLSSLLGDRRNTVLVNGGKAKVICTGARETLLDVTDLKCAVGDVARFPLEPMFARGLKRVYR